MTVETTVLIMAAISALISMAFYLQRTVQGGAFGVASSLGSQFDGRDPYVETQRLEMWEEVHQQTASSMVAANHLEQPPANDAYQSVVDPRTLACGGGDDVACERLDRTLESLPTGRVLREPASQLVEVTASWNATTDAEYRDYK